VHNELDLVFYAIRAAWPHLVARGGGAIVNVGSISATRGAWFTPQNAHGATKGGVLGLTYQLAVEGGPLGIRVNAISPALTRTPATEPLLTDPSSPFVLDKARIPLGRVGEPEDIARAAAFLASNDAAYITGVNLPVDGGTAAVG
jgi:meso-butanediol dehydrogenase/(S,S)-butanediol dehydrogenase/diacetyl reductase